MEVRNRTRWPCGLAVLLLLMLTPTLSWAPTATCETEAGGYAWMMREMAIACGGYSVSDYPVSVDEARCIVTPTFTRCQPVCSNGTYVPIAWECIWENPPEGPGEQCDPANECAACEYLPESCPPECVQCLPCTDCCGGDPAFGCCYPEPPAEPPPCCGCAEGLAHMTACKAISDTACHGQKPMSFVMNEGDKKCSWSCPNLQSGQHLF